MHGHQPNFGQLLLLKVHELRWDSALEHALRRLQPGGLVIDASLIGGADAVREFLERRCGLLTMPSAGGGVLKLINSMRR